MTHIPPDLLGHWLDHYGQCSRDNGKQNDCYHGKDAAGRDNGCLKVGWQGRTCPHWTSISEDELVWLVAAHTYKDARPMTVLEQKAMRTATQELDAEITAALQRS